MLSNGGEGERWEGALGVPREVVFSPMVTINGQTVVTRRVGVTDRVSSLRL